ncbi:hypothetical protein [Arenimonas sp.]|uniref:hypothetical protein n=1 Tax=Arenimonas sp. TaxID=1872635 RepID=UPI0039E23476
MASVAPRTLPDDALLQRYRERGAYTDCYSLDLPVRILQAEYVEAFYTTWVFRLERAILSVLVSKPSTDAQAAQLARGERGDFAAWDVEAREADQLLMRDFQKRTCSWLMSRPLENGDTRLYFGSAVVPRIDPRSGGRSMGPVFAALLGFHRLYTRILLRAAAARLMP